MPIRLGREEQTKTPTVLLRFYFPKGTNFKRISAVAFAKAVRRSNNRPRKCLGYRTPQEVYDEARSGALAN
jgi:IS30 family transposase